MSIEVAEVPFSGAWQPVRGRWYLMLSKPLLRASGLSVGQTAEVRFRVEPQDAVEIPASLERALGADPSIKAAFEALTPRSALGAGPPHHLGPHPGHPGAALAGGARVPWL